MIICEFNFSICFFHHCTVSHHIYKSLHLCTFKTPTSCTVMSERGDTDCTHNGEKKLQIYNLFYFFCLVQYDLTFDEITNERM